MLGDKRGNLLHKYNILQDSKVHIYSLSGGTLKETSTQAQTGSITCVAYSPDGAYLAASDANRKVELYSCPDYKVSKSATFSRNELLHFILIRFFLCFVSERVPHYLVFVVIKFSQTVHIPYIHNLAVWCVSGLILSATVPL